MEIIKNTNFGKSGIKNFQVTFSDKFNESHLSNEDIENIEKKLNGRFGSITIREYELRRTIELMKLGNQLNGVILYENSVTGFGKYEWELIEQDIKSVIEQLNSILSTKKK